MTLFRQLALLISLIIITILTTVSLFIFNSAMNNAQKQLHADAQNTAASLSLSLATAHGDVSMMETMINANFDSGHYALIALENMEGEVVIERSEKGCQADIPEWFVKLVNIDAQGASVQVSSGWMVIGTLYVESDRSYMYATLYEMFKSLMLSFVLFMVVSLGLLNMMLYRILKPLDAMKLQADAINQNEFRYQEKLPYTKEFKTIVMSMNALVKKIELNFKTSAKVVQTNRQLLYTEKLPKLYNAHYLMLKCHEEGLENSEHDGGVLLAVTLKETVVDESDLMDLAAVLIEKSTLLSKSLVARVHDATLVLFMPGATESEACHIVKSLKKLERGDEMMFGVHIYKSGDACEGLLEHVTQKMHSSEENCMTEGKKLEQKEALSHQEWVALINSSLEHQRFNYEVRNVINVTTNTIHDRGLSIVMRDEAGTNYTYGRFIGAAIKEQKVLSIYMQVIQKMVQNFSNSDRRGRYTFTFSQTLLLQEETFSILKKEFDAFENTHELDFCIELPESFVVANPDLARRYITLVKEHGYRFGMGEFSAESDDLEYLKTFKPEFVKISKLFLLDLITQASPLLSSLQVATDALGIDIIATGVSTKEELEKIQGAGISIVQGMITEVM